MKTLVNLAYKLGLRIKNYAVSVNDTVLKTAVDLSKSDLKAGRAIDIINRCKKILDKAISVTAEAPAEYKITPELITETSSAIDAFMIDIPQRTLVGGTHSAATEELAALFITAKSQLQILDDLIEGDADKEDSEFVRNYFIMRRTVDRRTRAAKKSNGSVAVAEAGEPEAH